MLNIICCNTGDVFGQWYVDNLKHMIDEYSGLKYDTFNVITEEKHTGVFNKLQMFDKFKTGQNLYFDLDVCIYKETPNLLRKELTVLEAWWREPEPSPLNSSVISWEGYRSDIYKKFLENPNEIEKQYHRGIDPWLYDHIKPETYKQICYSIQGNEYRDSPDWFFSFVLFNQRRYLMEPGWKSWWNDYFKPRTL